MTPHRPEPPFSQPNMTAGQGRQSPPVRLTEQGQLPPRRMGPGGGGPGGRRPAPPKKRSGLLSALFSFVLFLLLVASAGLGYLLINPPSDFIRQTLIDQVKAKTGRDLVIAGPASFTVYPGLGVSLSDVSLSGPDGAKTPVAAMERLTVNVKAVPLFSRTIVVERLAMRKPVIDLRIDKAGRKNWDLAANATPQRYAQAGAAPAAAPPGDKAVRANRLSQLKDFSLDDMVIEDGIIRFTDERAATTQQVSGLNVRAKVPSLQSTMTADGDLEWRGQKIAFDGELTSAEAVLTEQPAKLVFKASNALVGASYDGSVALKQGADLDGLIAIQTPSARALAGWFGTELPPVAGFGPFSINGALKTAGSVTQLLSSTFGLDGATGTGNVVVTTGGARPAVQANLKISELDLNKYITRAAGGDAAPIATEPAPAAPAPGAPLPPDEIEKLLKKTGSKVYGAVQRAGWSSEAMNFALLGVADINSKLNVGRLLFQDIKVGQTAMTVALKNRVMQANLDQVELYEGVGKGTVTVDGSAGTAANIKAGFDLQGLSALPFLKDASSIDWLAGKSNVNLNLTAKGASQLQLVESLGGKAVVNFRDGAIVGFNLPGAIRNISNGKFSGLKKAPSEKTDFSEMSASFDIANGVARNTDLSLVSPLLRVSGAGAIELPPRTVDYTVKPKLVASLEGQTSSSPLSGLEIPVRITGPWASPRYEPDLAGVLSNPDQAIDAVKKLTDKYKGKDANQIVDDLLGGKSSGGDTTDTKQKAKDLLKNLFGK